MARIPGVTVSPDPSTTRSPRPEPTPEESANAERIARTIAAYLAWLHETAQTQATKEQAA